MTTSISRTVNSVTQRKAGRWLLGGVAVVFLLAFLSWLLLPAYIKRVAEEQAQQQTGRKLTIDTVNFSPFSLAVRADGVRLYEADQKNIAAEIRSADINLSLSSVFYGALALDEIRISQPQVHIVRTSADGSGRYNFSDILDKLAQAPKSDKPFEFSIANIQLSDGKVLFDDQVFHQHSEITQLNIGLPFVSNFPRKINTFVEPRMTAFINGAGFALNATTRPFAEDKETRLALDLEKFNLKPFLAYLPFVLPVQVEQATLSTRLDLIFKEAKQSEILLAGSIDLNGVDIRDKEALPLLKFGNLHAQLRKLNVMDLSADIDQLSLSNPEVWVNADARHGINWAQLKAPADNKKAVGQQAMAVQAKPAAAEKAASPDIFVRNLQVRQGQVHVNDHLFAKAGQETTLHDIEIALSELRTTPAAAPARLKLDLKAGEGGSFHAEGALQAMQAAFEGKLHLEELALEDYQAYLQTWLKAAVQGKLNAETAITLKDGQVALNEGQLKLDNLNIKNADKQQGGLSWKALSLDQIRVDTQSKNLQLGTLAIDGINADVQRDAQGKINLMAWMDSGHAENTHTGSVLADGKEVAVAHDANNGWKASLAALRLNGAQLQYADQAVTPAVKLKADGLQLQLDNLDTALSKQIAVNLQSQLNRKGKMQIKGTLSPGLKQAQMTLDIQNFPVATIYPYLSSALNVQINKGHASTKGRLNIQNLLQSKPQISFDGNLSLNDFDIVQNDVDDDFLNWKNISLEGIQLRLGGDRQLVQLNKLALNQFYARAVLSEKGELNLRHILAKPEGANTAADSKADAQAAVKNGAKADAKGDVKTVSASAPATVAAASPLVIRIAETSLSDSNINFTDHFIKPNYHANLTGISGKIGAIASDQPQAATVELNGKVDDDAPLLISGSVNPLSSPVFLDLKGSANGIELTRLTPYATKYAGYAIEKGKLSMQVSYHIENQQLKAENSLTLDQLTFGERVDSPTATKLPVMLAVALLRDNDGRIAINLPVSGSLSDPQFSVGGIIFKVFINLITKAVTSPFALLGSMFGSGEELAYVEFQPGSMTLTPASQTRLDHLVTALSQRSALKLDITGRADPQTDADGLRKALLESQLKTAKWKDQLHADRRVNPSELTLTPQERERYVQKLYSDGQFAKPKNLIGLAKTLPVSEAEQMILKNMTVSDEDLRMLAQKRADMVRDYLEDSGHIARERLFLIAPKVSAQDIKDKGSPNRVDFSLK